MQLADLEIDQLQTQTQQTERTYADILDQDGAWTSAESQFEQDCVAMLVEGWQLKLVSHRGSIIAPQTVVAIYAK